MSAAPPPAGDAAGATLPRVAPTHAALAVVALALLLRPPAWRSLALGALLGVVALCAAQARSRVALAQ
jgi:hypothetical protein